MYQHFYAAGDLTVFPIAGLILFFAFFIGVVISVYFVRRDTTPGVDRYQGLAQLVLDDGDAGTKSGSPSHG